jgi:hypothetical protein
MIAKELLLDPDCHRRIAKMQDLSRMRVMDQIENARS